VVRMRCREQTFRAIFVIMYAFPRSMRHFSIFSVLLIGCTAFAQVSTALQAQKTVELIAKFGDVDANVRRIAVMDLVKMDAVAVPSLLEALDSAEDKTARYAADALVGIGQNAMPGLIAAFESASKRSQFRIVRIWSRLGPIAKDAAPPLILLYDENAEMRRAAIFALASIGPESSEATRKLLEVQHGSDKDARSTAIFALENAARDARSLIDSVSSLPFDVSNALAAVDYEKLCEEEATSTQYRDDTAELVYSVNRKSIPSDMEGFCHYEVTIQFEGSPKAIFLARLRVPIPDFIYGRMGIAESTLSLESLENGRLLHLYWRTCPMGQGTNTIQTHLLLRREGECWDEIFRDTQDFYGRDGPLVRYTYRYDSDSLVLSIEAEDSSGLNRAYRDPTPRLREDAVTRDDVIFITEWRFRVSKDELEYLGGSRRVDVDQRALHVYSPQLETRTPREFKIESLARFLYPNKIEETIERIRQLNPTLKSSDVCSGVVLIETHVRWRGANEKHYYSMEE